LIETAAMKGPGLQQSARRIAAHDRMLEMPGRGFKRPAVHFARWSVAAWPRDEIRTRCAMKDHVAKRAFSMLSIGLLLVAVASVLVSALISIVGDHELIWRTANWTCGISVAVLVASLIHDARK
jgi:hypothetical protein